MANNGIELGKAFVQIVPSADGISGSITKVLGGEAESAGKSAGTSIATKIKSVIAAAGIGAALKAALTEGGALQQSIGGVETLYGNAADAIKNYAKESYKFGLSANEYMEQSTSFAAALRDSLGGDVVAAAESANLALNDMADNSAKMGTDMTSIQNAYQGFAKQNYTMLDNLKLGYGGTKSEMERLLSKAEELSGIHYDINNLSDVYSAIHVIQENLGLTGVAADEAKTTFTGSMEAMKAAAQNVLGNLALGEDIKPSLQALSDTAITFLADNLLPMCLDIFEQLPAAAIDAIDAIGDNLAERFPGMQLLFENLETVVIAVTTAFIAYKAAAAISGVIDKLKKATEAQTTAQALLNAVMNANPFVLVATLIAGVVAALVVLWNTNEDFRNAVIKTWDKIKGAFSSALSSIKNALSNIGSTFVNIGRNIVDGVWRGISNAATWFTNKVKSFFSGIVDNVKKVLGIHSPSRVFAGIGGYMAEGLGEGWNSEYKTIEGNIVTGLSDGVERSRKAIAGASADMQRLTGNFDGSVTVKAQQEITGNLIAALSTMKVVLDSGETVGFVDAGLSRRQVMAARGV